MKKIYMITVVFVVTAISFSCEDDFINLIPEDQESSSSFFKNEEQFRQAVTAAYVPLRGFSNNDFYLAEMRSDNTHYERYVIRGTKYEMKDNIADFAIAPNNNYVYNLYKACYTGISRANIVIERIKDTEIPETAKNDIEGEAKFLRAFYYFQLVRYFGGVPLSLQEVTTADEAFLPRSSAEDVYSQIIMDAMDAIENLEVPENFPQSGVATKGAAIMLLSDVYMAQHKYADAETLLKKLPDMGYQLLPDYAAVFSTANKNSKESIFEVQYMQGLEGGQESNFIYHFLPRSKNTSIVTGVATNNVGNGGYNTPTQDLINSYEKGDTRLNASIGIVEGTYNKSGQFAITANKSIVDYTPTEGKTGVPYIKKYLNPHTDPNNTDDNWPVYRYSGALLLLASALNEQGKGPEALPYLNQVRARAGLEPINTTDQNELRDYILHERRVELAFENHRWHDLVRTEKAIEVMTAYGNMIKERYSYLRPDSYNITPDKLLYPIPSQEIELNPDLTQNPGY